MPTPAAKKYSSMAKKNHFIFQSKNVWKWIWMHKREFLIVSFFMIYTLVHKIKFVDQNSLLVCQKQQNHIFRCEETSLSIRISFDIVQFCLQNKKIMSRKFLGIFYVYGFIFLNFHCSKLLCSKFLLKWIVITFNVSWRQSYKTSK
jgi:hypothetical protein